MFNKDYFEIVAKPIVIDLTGFVKTSFNAEEISYLEKTSVNLEAARILMANPELVDGILALDPDALKNYFELSGVKVVSIRINDIEEIKGLLLEGLYVSSLLNEKLELGGYLVSEVMEILGDNYYRVKK